MLRVIYYNNYPCKLLARLELASQSPWIQREQEWVFYINTCPTNSSNWRKSRSRVVQMSERSCVIKWSRDQGHGTERLRTTGVIPRWGGLGQRAKGHWQSWGRGSHHAFGMWSLFHKAEQWAAWTYVVLSWDHQLRLGNTPDSISSTSHPSLT